MKRLSARAKNVLHASMLLLLVLGLFVRPILNLVGEIHGATHVAAAAEHGHSHWGNDHTAGHDQDHASGSHGLLHQADSSSTSGMPVSFGLPEVEVAVSQALHWAATCSLPQRLSSPFRPPIA